MRVLLPVALLAVGCSCGSSGSSPGPDRPPAPEPTPAADTSRGPSTYSVHEWGLVRAGAGDTLAVGAMGPAAPPMDLMIIEKPVLYFHVTSGSPIELASVGVEALGGSIVEHWPRTGAPAAPAPTSIEWTGLRLEPATCPLIPPTVADFPCGEATASGACESLSLGRAATTDSACVRSAAGDSPLLFYRSTSTGLTVPLVASLRSGDVEVRNDGDLPIPGRLVRFRRARGQVQVVVASPPAPHETILVGRQFGDPPVARAAVTESLAELGLSPAEAGAFLASWDEAFFGAPAPAEMPPVRATERTVNEESPPPEESLLYFLPAADIERIARLWFDPAPIEVRRAMAVWAALR